jgi:hypothetical protein
MDLDSSEQNHFRGKAGRGGLKALRLEGGSYFAFFGEVVDRVQGRLSFGPISNVLASAVRQGAARSLAKVLDIHPYDAQVVCTACTDPSAVYR